MFQSCWVSGFSSLFALAFGDHGFSGAASTFLDLKGLSSRMPQLPSPGEARAGPGVTARPGRDGRGGVSPPRTEAGLWRRTGCIPKYLGPGQLVCLRCHAERFTLLQK